MGSIVILRHAERPPILPGTFGDDLEITPEGRRTAEEFGKRLAGEHPIGVIHTSPVLRCVQTAEAIRQGAARPVDIREDTMLGNPSVFVADLNTAGRHFLEAGPRKVVKRLLQGEPLEGMRPPKEGTDMLLRALLQERTEGLTICVTHDAILACLQNALTGLPYEESHWPGYLEAVWLTPAEKAMKVAWRGREFVYALGS